MPENLTIHQDPQSMSRQLQAVALQPGDVLERVSDDWVDIVHVVEEAELAMEGGSGSRDQFAWGAVLTISGLPGQRPRNFPPRAVGAARAITSRTRQMSSND